MRVFLTHWKLRWGFPLSVRDNPALEVAQTMRKSAFQSYVLFEIFLALALFAAGLMVVFSFLFVADMLGPQIFQVEVYRLPMDAPMTVGVFLYLVSVVGIPWFLFHYVGIPSLRDCHQLCKEMRDCLLQASKFVETRMLGSAKGDKSPRDFKKSGS
jgi:hypothetical protein